MHDGKGGWTFPLVEFKDAKKLAIVHMTMKPDRPNGHVGILITDVQFGSVAKMAHASFTYGFIAVIVEDRPDNYYHKRITRLRQPRG
jgi:hypothetical protein